MKRALLIAELVVVLLIARNWAYVTTYRLYLDHRVGAADRSSAAQQFDIEQSRVVPQIVTRGPDHLSFAIDVRQGSTVRVELRPVHRAAYEIAWPDGDRRRVLAAGSVDSATPLAADYPGGTGIVELVSNDAVSWVDPRVVRGLSVRRHLVALALLAAGLVFLRSERGVTRLAMRLVAVTIGAIGACVAAEVALRAMGDAAPGGIMTERHDLGEVTRDARWMDSRRYGRRLRPKVDVINEWRDGDIVRMGYLPRSVSESTLRRFRFETDSEGFRNPSVRERFEIAALGDSFTDAMTMEAEASWPSQLEKRLGVTVQNYGTAGFGPQQEERVLEDFVARHGPRIVVLAYFAGNDLFDAEAFDEFERSGVERRTAPGWRIKDVVNRADTWFVTSALRASIRGIGKPHDPPLAAATGERQERPAMPSDQPSFDRGMFTVPVNGGAVRFAFMPPYLNTLNFSESDLRARAGWRLTAKAIRSMRDQSRSHGAEFVVVFVPFKSQVYLPLVEREFSGPQLKAALSFYLDIYGRPVDLELMHRNRFAQNDLMRRLCEGEGIRFVDTTPALESRLQTGENVYFPDESHLNEAGEALVAETFAVFLRAPEQQARDSGNQTGIGTSRVAPLVHRATASDMHVMQTR